MASSGMRGGGGGGGSSAITVKAARVMGFSSPDQMKSSPNYASKLANLNKKTRATIDQVAAATGRKMSVNQAVNYMYNRM